MTDTDLARDAHDSYLVACLAMRQRALAEGALPVEGETIDLVLLATLRAKRGETDDATRKVDIL